MIVIPTYNERKNIRELILRIRRTLPRVPVLFVDDSSPDGTADEIREVMKTDPNIRLLMRPGKQGLGSAYREGFMAALNDPSTDFVAEMDADLSHAPEALSEMLKALSENDVVIGSRYVSGGQVENWNFPRRFISRAGNWYARLLTGNFAKDLTAGFVAYRKDALRKIDLGSIKSDGYAFQIELKYLLSENNCRIKEIPITFSERRTGESKFSSNIFGEGFRLPWKLLLRNARKHPLEKISGLAVFLVPLAVYALTAPHTIYLGDSPEFSMAVATLGVPHPPGYPTYLVLAKLFSLLPLGTLAFRLGLFSAVCSAAALFFLYRIGLLLFALPQGRSARATVAAAVAPFILAFTGIFWSQAIMAKTYQLHLLIVVALIWLSVKYWQQPKASRISWAAFLFGLGFGAHQMIVFFGPVFLLALLIRKADPESGLYRIHPQMNWKVLLSGAAFLLLGLSIYAYLPIRSSMHPVYQWENVHQSLSEFLRYVGRSEYADLARGFQWRYKVEFLASFFQDVYRQFGSLLLIALPGLWWLFRKQRNFALLSVSIFLLNGLGIILTRSLPWTFDGEAYSSFYYLPAYALAAFWIASGAFWLFSFESVRRYGAAMLLLVLLGSAGYFASTNLAANDLSKFTFLDDYSRDILLSLEPNAVLMFSFNGAVNDSVVFALYYQQKVNGIRPDVKLADGYDVYPSVDRQALNMIFDLGKINNFRALLVRYMSKQPEYKNRPLYTTFPADNLGDTWFSVSNGLVFRWYADRPGNVSFKDTKLTDRDRVTLERTYFGRDLLAQYYYGLAGGRLDQEDKAGAQRAFLSAIRNDNEVSSEDAAGYMAHREKIDNLKK